MKILIISFLPLFLTLALFDSTQGSSKHPFHPYKPRDVGTSGTGTSEAEGTGSIPATRDRKSVV